jgi:hypothetical protein
MLFGGTVAVCCKNHTERTGTVHTSQETHYISATEPNRLMLFRGIISVYCENRTELLNALREQNVEFMTLKQMVHNC